MRACASSAFMSRPASNGSIKLANCTGIVSHTGGLGSKAVRKQGEVSMVQIAQPPLCLHWLVHSLSSPQFPYSLTFLTRHLTPHLPFRPYLPTNPRVHST